MHHLKESRVEWYVVFTATKLQHWIYRLVDRDIGHVYAVQSLNDYQWLVVNTRLNITEMKIMLKCQYPSIYDLTSPDDKVIKVQVKPVMCYRGTLNWFNCVEQIKAILGIKSFWTWTPKQLYKGLIGGRYG